MSLEEKIAQLFMPIVSANGNAASVAHCERLICENHIGGIFLDGKTTVRQQVDLVNRLQKVSRVPLLIGQDLEWGTAMRLTDGMLWPKALTLGAVADDNLIYSAARAMADQARAIGVHITASPVLDINTNPLNPVINVRSFGSCRENVERKAVAFMRGLHDGKILACGKHFPGHGDTHSDSHLTLPIVAHDKNRLFSIELAPFKKLIESGISLVMIGHLSVPALDPTGDPATLSHPIITDVLKNKLGFDGLVISDALNMHALPAIDLTEINMCAIMAGTDLLIYAEKIPESIALIKKMVRENKISERDITERALKVLRAKEWLGLVRDVQVDSTVSNRARPNARDNKLKKKLYEHALTRVRDTYNALPLSGFLSTGSKKILVAEYGPRLEPFVKSLRTLLGHQACKHTLDERALVGDWRERTASFENYDMVVIAINTKLAVSQGIVQDAHNKTSGPRQCDLKTNVEKICVAHKKCVIVLFSSPYELLKLPCTVPTLVVCEPDEIAQEVAAQALVGEKAICGKLPVEID